MFTLKLYFIVIFLSYTMGGFDEKVQALTGRRSERGCEVDSDMHEGMQHLSMGMLILVTSIGILIILLLLGLTKALLGLFISTKIGMFGMGTLVDLPRPMKKYQEVELADMPVIYDIAGWPVHPQSRKRTVRALSRTTEFCMNVIFFITYPFVIMVSLCSLICYKSYDEEGTDNKVYHNVNTVVFAECPKTMVAECKEKSKLCATSCVGDIYRDEDSAEEADTKYVMDQMSKSQDNLNGSP